VTIETVELLRRIEGHLAVLAGRETVARGTRLGDADRLVLLELLPAIHGVLGDYVFSVGDLAYHDDTHEVVERYGAKSLGKLFARTAGIPAGDFIVVRVSVARNGVLWQIRRM